MRSVKKRHMRGACVCLCVCLCALPLLEALAENAAAPLPTPTLIPAEDIQNTSENGTPVTDVTPTPEPSTPTNEPGGTDSGTPTADPGSTAVPTATLTPAASETPTPVPETSETPTPETTETPTPETSETPTPVPETSGTPTAVPASTPEGSTPPVITELPSVSPAPVWDESQCDHMNEHCERAPKCTVPGCRHIGVNEAGDVVALCGLGQWLMEVGSDTTDGIMTLAATAPIEMELVDGENILYRSGSYHLTGGGENATLYIRDNMVLSIELDGVQLLTLRVSQKSVVTIGFQGYTTIQTLTAPDAAVKLSGSGCLTVANNLNYGVLNVERGNVRLPSGASSDNGRRPVVFDAPGAEQAYVDGKFFTYVKTGSDGKVTLWLPVPGEGASYWGRMNGNTLEVSSLAEPPVEDDKVDLSAAEPFRAEAGKSYTLYASDPANQGRVINGAAGASFTLAGAGTEGSAPTFQGDGGTLYVSGDTYLNVLSGPYAVSGTGRLHVGTLFGDGLTAQGGLTIRAAGGSAPAAWTAVQVSGGDAALDLTAQYIRICGIGCVFIVFYNLISCIFRGLGNSRLPLLFVGIACVVNIVGDLLLVAVLDMNVAGAAIATIGAQAVSVILSLLIIRRQKLPFSFSMRDIRLDREVGGFVRVGAPLALQELLTNITFLAICAFINRLGLDASNGYGIAQKIQSFVMLVPSSIMQCMASFVAQNVGANKEERARKGMLYGMGVGAAIGVVIAALALFKGDVLASLFSGSERDIARAFEYLRGFAPEAVLTSVLFSFLGYFNGHSRSTFVMVQSIAQAFLIRLPVSYFLSIQPGVSLTGVGLAVPLSTVFGIAMCLVYYRRMNQKTQATPSDASLALDEPDSQAYNPEVSTVIAISRSYGAGGRTVGRMVAQRLGIPFYDKELLQEAAKKSGLCEKIFENFDERPKSLLYSIAMDSYMFALPGSGAGDSLEQQVYLATFNTIRHLADQGPCVIIGRCADYALADYPNHLSLFISAPLKVRIQRVAQRQNLTPEKARQLILKTDKRRASYYEYYSSKKWGSVDSYHFCIDSSYLGLGRTVELIQAMVAHKEHPIPSPTEEDPTRPRT